MKVEERAKFFDRIQLTTVDYCQDVGINGSSRDVMWCDVTISAKIVLSTTNTKLPYKTNGSVKLKPCTYTWGRGCKKQCMAMNNSPRIWQSSAWYKASFHLLPKNNLDVEDFQRNKQSESHDNCGNLTMYMCPALIKIVLSINASKSALISILLV